MMTKFPVSRVQATGVDVITAGFPTAADWWDPNNEGLCIWSAYQPKGAANFAASLLDLSGNGNNAGDPGGAATPPWDAVNGWKFDGIADYLTTTFVPQNDQTQSGIVQFTNVTNVGVAFGVHNGANRRFKIYPNRTNTTASYHNGRFQHVAPPLLAGNLAVAGNQGYRTGAADGPAIGAWAGASTFPVYIGARNGIGVADFFCAIYIQAVALYDCTLTAPQVAAVATAMALL